MSSAAKGARPNLGWMFRVLSASVSGLALVALTRHAFVMSSLSAPMALVMDAYNSTMQVLFGWADPYLQAALNWTNSLIGSRLVIDPHWRDLFVVYALASAGIHHSMKPPFTWSERVSFGLFLLSVVIVLTLLGSLHIGPPDLMPVVMAGVVLGAALLLIFIGWMGWDKNATSYVLLAGLTILTGFVGALCFFVIDAGLKLLGA